MAKKRALTYQEGWAAGLYDFEHNRPKADVRAGTDPLDWTKGAGQARILNGNAWADGYGHFWAMKEKQ